MGFVCDEEGVEGKAELGFGGSTCEYVYWELNDAVWNIGIAFDLSVWPVWLSLFLRSPVLLSKLGKRKRKCKARVSMVRNANSKSQR